MDEEEQLELWKLDNEDGGEEEEEEYVWDLTGMNREELEVSSDPLSKRRKERRLARAHIVSFLLFHLLSPRFYGRQRLSSFSPKPTPLYGSL